MKCSMCRRELNDSNCYECTFEVGIIETTNKPLVIKTADCFCKKCARAVGEYMNNEVFKDIDKK